MAPTPKNGNSQTLLYLNVLTLVKLEGASSQLKEYVKPGIFSKPNRIAFEHTLYFLIKAYDPQLCRSTITCWPITERKTQERIFKREVVAAISMISSQEPNFPLPTFSHSFLSSPGGERLETFLCRFSCLALRSVLQHRRSCNIPYPPRGLDPQRCLTIAKSQTHGKMHSFLKKNQQFVAFVKYCAETAESLKKTLVSTLSDIRNSRAIMIGLNINESTSLEDVFNEEISTELRDRLSALLKSLQIIENQEKLARQCETAVRMVTDDQQSTAALEPEELLDIADLFNRTANVVESLSSRFEPLTTPATIRELKALAEGFTNISDLMEKNLRSVVELTVAAGSSTQIAESNVGTPERLRHVCQMLEDANHATPPLEFRPATTNPILADTESSPIINVADLLGAQKSCVVNGTKNTLLGRKPLLRTPAAPKVSEKLGCTPARPRSEIPVKAASRSLRSMAPNPNENASKIVASRLLPKAVPAEMSTNSLRSLKVPNEKEAFDIITNNDLDKEGSARNLLDLAVSVLSPVPSRNTSIKEEFSPKEDIEVSKLEKKFADLKFSESMNDSSVIKELVSESKPEKSVAEKKTTEKRKSILDLIERYKNIVPVSENTATSLNVGDEAEPEEWKDSDNEFSLGSDEDFDEKDYEQMKFELSAGF